MLDTQIQVAQMVASLQNTTMLSVVALIGIGAIGTTIGFAMCGIFIFILGLSIF